MSKKKVHFSKDTKKNDGMKDLNKQLLDDLLYRYVIHVNNIVPGVIKKTCLNSDYLCRLSMCLLELYRILLRSKTGQCIVINRKGGGRCRMICHRADHVLRLRALLHTMSICMKKT